MPNAQVVADRFHVMSQINQELDRAIKLEKSQANKDYKSAKNPGIRKKLELRIEALKNSKYPLLKNEQNLNERQKEKLESVRKISPRLRKRNAPIKRKIPKNFSEITIGGWES